MYWSYHVFCNLGKQNISKNGYLLFGVIGTLNILPLADAVQQTASFLLPVLLLLSY